MQKQFWLKFYKNWSTLRNLTKGEKNKNTNNKKIIK